MGVTCATPTSCLAVGLAGLGPLGGPPHGVLVPITNGVPGSPQDVPGTSFLGSVICPASTSCLATGYGPIAGPLGQAGVVVPIINGIPGSPQDVPGTMLLGALSCVTPTRCLSLGTAAA